ncbi:ABC transporter ATP-binding protein [Microbacter margulisiae]|uniref:ATP-binding cassette subfamily B protein n=1 Tax=Microbacter margulisiae TaxID=1350067 RepID=A0A7W5H108_9PORP|nr:ABC transporter ATP-binding protein [Microbacter margulisiae]MBB3185867.1 ATP-binding cassette subfamily B protein [Microbacter margulisiae]
MNYNLNLNKETSSNEKAGTITTLKRLLALMDSERKNLFIALIFIFINAGLNLISPYLIGHAVDKFIVTKHYAGVIRYAVILLVIFVMAMFSGYTQAQLMGKVGQRMLFNLRNRLFNKLQELPIDFFNQNKAGDLISRVNNDTDKINQFFSQSFVQFMSSIFTMIGAAIFLISIDFRLGLAALSPAVILWIFTRSFSPWVKRRNTASMRSTGILSAEVQESLQNFKVIVAFNRRDYFRKRFDEVNTDNYRNAVKAGIANTVFTPVYGFLSNIGQLIVLAFGIYLIMAGQFSIGLLISFLAYITQFYNPLRQLAALWANFQVALAGWDRISQILVLENNLPLVPDAKKEKQSGMLSFRHVSFAYPSSEKEILRHVSFDLERGKTYAFVGPTGGGKTTTASLMARLYDPTSGKVLLDGVDIRSMDIETRTAKIGFILQEPFLFTGSLHDNILYGNVQNAHLSDDELLQLLSEAGLHGLLDRFEGGLNARIDSSGDGISLGQKQLIAFIRAVLRKPDVLILDEATANIDTVTEQLLEDVLQKLPSSTTRIIIAHRLNTIENADEIFFVNAGNVTKAGSLQDAVDLLLHKKRVS